LSALPFAPEHSLVAKNFSSRFPNTLAVIEGRPAQWPITLFTAEYDKGFVKHLVFSPDEKTFAFISSFHKVYICDSETGHLILGRFELKSLGYGVCFSPNGTHILVEGNDDAVVWDIERGEKQFETKGSGFVFIHHGRWHDRITSIDEDGSSILVKLWGVENSTPKFSILFEAMDTGLTQFSPDGRFLAVGRKFEGAIELWNVEDGENTQQFPHSSSDLSSLCFSLTSDILMVIFEEPKHICVWRLDIQEMVTFSGDIPTAIIHAPLTSHLFIPQDHIVEIWEVSMTSSHMTSPHMIYGKKPLTPSQITSICPSQDGNKILVGSYSGIVSMWDVNLARNQAATMDTQDDVREVIAVSPSGKMVATISE